MNLVPIENVLHDPAQYLVYSRTGVLARSESLGYTLTRRAKRAAQQWDESTILGPLVTSPGGIVVARGFNKILTPGMHDFPETRTENWDIDAEVEITRLYDGMRGIVFQTALGTKIVAAEDGIDSKTTSWATHYYCHNHRGAVWPEGFTPEVCILKQDLNYPIRYPVERLVLVGLVEIHSGRSLDYNALRLWGERNHFPVVERLRDDDATLKDELRGYVMTWPSYEEPALKIKIQYYQYDQARDVLADMSQWEIWRGMRMNRSFYRTWAEDRTLPPHFRRFIFSTGKRLDESMKRVKEEASRIVAECPHDPLTGAGFDWMNERSQTLFPVMYAMLKAPDKADDAIFKYLEPNMSKTPYFTAED